MRLTIKGSATTSCSLYELGIGETFLYQDRLCVKLDDENLDERDEVSSIVDLERFEAYCLDDSTRVIPVRAEINYL